MRAAIPAWVWEAVDGLEAKILSEEVAVPRPETREEMLAVRAQYPLTR